MRQQLFCRGPVFAQPDMFHPDTRQEILQEVAANWGLQASQVDTTLYADLPQEQLLTDAGPAWSPHGLIQRYNLELSRGALYRATVVQIDIYDNYKDIWRYLKLFRIMFLVEAIPAGGYRLLLSGPLSDFVETDRYGVSFASFLPAVILGERWQLVAKVKPYSHKRTLGKPDPGTPQKEEPPLLYYRLDNTCGLLSHYRKGRDYDSSLERNFASEFTDFEEKFGEERGKWKLIRENQVLVLDGTVMIPDFLLVHTQDEQRRILIELVGFWSPRYLKTKIAKAKAVHMSNLLLIVYEELKVTKEDFEGIEGDILFFKQKPVIKEIMTVVESLADRVYGPIEKGRQIRETPPPPSLSQLVRACQGSIGESGEQWYSLKHLQKLLKGVDSSFSPRRHGYSTLSSLVKANPDLFEIREEPTKDHSIEVRLGYPQEADTDILPLQTGQDQR
jgi:predicted nuclease of restriction endonuclease-like RecB superfamily